MRFRFCVGTLPVIGPTKMNMIAIRTKKRS